MKRCVTCGIEKEENEFNWRWKALGIRHPTCRKCHKTFRRKWYQGDAHERHLQNVKERKQEARNVAREYVYEYLKAHPCTQCGETDPVVLEFHHVGEKDMDVAMMVAGGYSVERIQAELKKCVVLCANCHRKVTHAERGWFRGRK